MRFLVQCINDQMREPPAGYYWLEPALPIIKGNIYTVRGSYIDPLDNALCYLLDEFYRPAPEGARLRGLHEVGFLASRFRPVDPKRLDVFRRALVSPKKKVEA